MIGRCFLRTSISRFKHELPKLPYDVQGGVPPTISPEQLHFHYNKHHKAYVDKLNELTKGTPCADAPLEDVVKKAWADAKKSKEKKTLFNQAAQHYNHTFYWFTMCPNGKDKVAELKKHIEKDFGGMDQFKTKFQEQGAANFGSGWTWLVKKGAKLEIVNTDDAEVPWQDDDKVKPILTCDVWEHAYYVDFRNERPKYLKGFWDVVNWEEVSKRFAAAS